MSTKEQEEFPFHTKKEGSDATSDPQPLLERKTGFAESSDPQKDMDRQAPGIYYKTYIEVNGMRYRLLSHSKSVETSADSSKYVLVSEYTFKGLTLVTSERLPKNEFPENLNINELEASIPDIIFYEQGNISNGKVTYNKYDIATNADVAAQERPNKPWGPKIKVPKNINTEQSNLKSTEIISSKLSKIDQMAEKVTELVSGFSSESTISKSKKGVETFEEKDFRATEHFRSIVWKGENYSLTEDAARIVSMLYWTKKDGFEELNKDDIFNELHGFDEAASKNKLRIRDSFQKGDAAKLWGNKFIEPSSKKGFYRINVEINS
jgi:hypothetical protein